MGAVAGFAALALIANPALGSATVAGTATVTSADNKVTVAFADVASPSLSLCWAQVTDPGGTLVDGNAVALTGNPASGKYTSAVLADGKYTVRAACIDGDGLTYLTPLAGVPVTLGDPAPGSSVGSVTLETGSSTGSLQKLFAS
ncbi:hypothetical protein FK531_09550 [Rhodococcus spelaei]|uniref:Ig-like domain-containing protein n=1 Tax=Rhodococcus spelaei TaxID=2546320 RepID=A0A541B9L8_9NOCA|nr:hypothetical protein [Rhodococcus spelaei]TQF69020.1 hypothetical protein FK531_09550 [Rhodococcus spelaei]